MKTSRCYIYLRVSTAVQVDGYSLDAQRDRIMKFAEYQNMEVVHEYCDAGKSGKSIAGRPEFQKMLDDVSYGTDHIDYILVFKLSRFGRNAGVAPYGYVLDSENDTITVDPDAASIVKLIFEKYVNEDMGLVEIADYLNNHGYKKKKIRSRDLDYYTPNFIRKVVDNPVYTGRISYGRSKTEKIKGTRDEYRRVKNDDYMLTDGLHEAIIDDVLWEGAQLKNRKVATTLKKKHSLDHEYLLSGLIRCPVCGGTITGTTAKRKNRKTGEVYYDFYYRCHNRTRLEDGSYCDFKTSYKEETFDNEVFDVIKSFVSSEGCYKEIMKHLDDTVDVSSLEAERTQLQSQLKQVVGAKDKLQEKIDALDVNDRHYNRKYEDMNIRLSNLYDKISNIEESIRVINRRIAQVRQKHLSSKEVYKALLNFEELYKNMTDEEKKEFYQDFIEEIHVHKDKEESERMVKSILFKFPLYYNGQVGDEIVLPKNNNVETVCILSKLLSAKEHIEITVDMDELDLTSAEAKATYNEIRDWVQEHYGMHVTNLNIAQVKQKNGIIERENYNKPKSPDSKQPGCPEEKVKAIEDAMRHFQMIK